MDDNLDDILSEPSVVKALPRAKFQPKAKPRPKKDPSSPAPSVSAVASEEQPVTSIPVNSELDRAVHPPDSVDKKLDAPGGSSLIGSAGTKQTLLSKKACDLEEVLVDGNLSAKARVEVDSAITGHSGNSISHSSADGHLVQNIGTSLGLKSPEEIIGQSTIAADRPAEVPTLSASTSHIEEEMSVFPDVAFTSGSPVRSCSAETAHDLSIPLMDHASGHYKENLVGNAEEFYIDMEQGPGVFSHPEAEDGVSDADAISEKRACKFQPKPKAQTSRKRDSIHVPETPQALSENQHMKGVGSVSTGEPDTNSENEYVFLDSANVGIQYNSSSPAKTLDDTATNRNESNEDDYFGEEASKKKRQQKPKKVASENEKPTRKRRKGSKPDENTEKPPKKFPHATRRKRSVDKSLLEAPEEELDLQRVPIRDLIILAEYKERQAKKAAMAQPPSTNERNDDTLAEDFAYDDGDTFGSDQDTGSLGIPSISRAVKDTRYFNYQTHMTRKQVRWSKQDTELFYQGVRQFGSDLSLIAELFPGRDRRQIKLKYKKEERQHAMRLNDALSSRAKDHSHFELVIQRLQERAAQKLADEDQMSGEDNSVHATDKEDRLDEGALGTHDTAAKSEQNAEGSAADREPDRAQAASPVELCNNEDDFDWDAYKSEL